MKSSKEIKLMIIENYIDWLITDEVERKEKKADAAIYVEEDHVDEIHTGLLEPIVDVLTSLAKDAQMAISGEWDVTTNEGRESFNDQIELIDTLGLINPYGLDMEMGQIEFDGGFYPVKNYRGLMFASEALGSKLFNPDVDKNSEFETEIDSVYVSEEAENVANSIAYFFDEETFNENTAEELYTIFDNHS